MKLGKVKSIARWVKSAARWVRSIARWVRSAAHFERLVKNCVYERWVKEKIFFSERPPTPPPCTLARLVSRPLRRALRPARRAPCASPRAPRPLALRLTEGQYAVFELSIINIILN
jgi:hypothetical protein